MPEIRQPPGLVVVTRDGCGLCETMLEELGELAAKEPIPSWSCLDVDSDAELVRRYGLKVPVLLLDGSPICHYVLDTPELLRILRRR